MLSKSISQNTIALVQGNPVIGLGVALWFRALLLPAERDVQIAGVLPDTGRRVLFNDVAGWNHRQRVEAERRNDHKTRDAIGE